jgi:hypothetical protein
MKISTKTIYSCDFCNKHYFRKHFCSQHEAKCSKNPDNDRPCLNNCSFLTKKEVDIDDQYFGSTRTVNIFYCKKFKNFIYPPHTEHKGNAFDTIDEQNIPMPKSCPEFYPNHGLTDFIGFLA